MKKISMALLMIFMIVYPALAKSITVANPAAGGIWQVGTHHNITWTFSGIAASAPIRIVLWQNGSKVDNIALGLTAGQGSYDWTVGTTQGVQATAGPGYSIRIRTEDSSAIGNSGAFLLSNALQLITPGQHATLTKPGEISLAPLRITKPKAGDSVDPFNGVDIEWNKTGTMDANVSVTLLRNGALAATLAASTPNTGQYIWNPQALNPDPGSYTVRVRTLDGACESTSNPFTMIEAGGIGLLSPAGGETWLNNSSHAVTWSRSGNIRTVTILLERALNDYQTLAQGIDAKLLTKTCTFVKSAQDHAEQVCYQVMIKDSLGHTTNPCNCFSLAWPGNPDLAIVDVNTSPSGFSAGTLVTFTVDIKNIGTAPALSCQGDFRLNNAVQKTFSVPSIDPGETKTVSFTWTAAAGTVKITVDTGNANADPNKTNNVWQRIYAIWP